MFPCCPSLKPTLKPDIKNSQGSNSDSRAANLFIFNAGGTLFERSRTFDGPDSEDSQSLEIVTEGLGEFVSSECH